MQRLTKFIPLGLAMLLSCSVYAEDFRLVSRDFSSSDALPVLYTCDGQGIAPSLSWGIAPKNSRAIAISLADTDTDKDILYHWIIYNIPISANFIERNKPLPSGSFLGKNSFDGNVYTPPCPEKGKAHTYVFSVYALDAVLKLPNDADAKTIMLAVKGHTLQKDDLMATYSRWPD